LTSNEDPPLVAAKEEFLAWVAEAPEPHRRDLERRLKSRDDHSHFSARLELFTHHYFLDGDWEIEIHPELENSSNRPDFLVEHADKQMYVECRTILDHHRFRQQDSRLRQVATEVGKKLRVTVMLEPRGDLPPTLPANQIRRDIEQQIPMAATDELLEVDVHGIHEEEPYALTARVFPRAEDPDLPLGVQGLMTPARTIVIGEQLRGALREKASKYGELSLPFIICVSAETEFPMELQHEVIALFGDKVWNLHQNKEVTTSWRPNGLFTVTADGHRRYTRVSAVFVYKFKWLEDGHDHRMHIYHNPFADMPIDPALFPNVPQFILNGDRGWINGEPEPY